MRTGLTLVVGAIAASFFAIPSSASAQGCDPPASAPSSSSSSSSPADDSVSSNAGGSSNDWGSSGWNDSDAGSSSSGSSGSSGSSEPTGCVDDTDLTGFEECTRFGSGWNATWPAIRLELGASFRRLSLDGLTLGGTAYHDGNPHRFTLTAGDLAEPSVFAAGFNLRMTVGLGRWFLLGTELDISSGGSPEGEVTHGDQSLTAGDVSALTGGVIFGVALPVGPLRFRGELFAGGQGIDVTATSVLGDCVSETSAILTRWVIEPRIGIELFLTPSLSVDLWGGADVVNPGNLAGGLRLNLHARGYDAVR